MEPTELAAVAVRLLVSSARAGGPADAEARLREVVARRLERSPQGSRALVELAELAEPGEAAELPPLQVSAPRPLHDSPLPEVPLPEGRLLARPLLDGVLLDVVLADREFRRRLQEAVDEALAAARPPCSARLRTSRTAAVAAVLAVAVATVLVFRASGEEQAAEPLHDPAVIRAVVPDRGSVPSDWTVTEQIQAGRCGTGDDCARLLGSAQAGWRNAELVVYAATSEAAAADVYRKELRRPPTGPGSATRTKVAGFGDECGGWRLGDRAAVVARSGTVVVRVAGTGTGSGPDSETERLARVTVARADQAQRGQDPNASMRG